MALYPDSNNLPPRIEKNKLEPGWSVTASIIVYATLIEVVIIGETGNGSREIGILSAHKNLGLEMLVISSWLQVAMHSS